MSYQLQYRLQQNYVWQRMGGGRTIWFLNCSPHWQVLHEGFCWSFAAVLWRWWVCVWYGLLQLVLKTVHLCTWARLHDRKDFTDFALQGAIDNSEPAWLLHDLRVNHLLIRLQRCSCIWQLKIWELLRDSKCCINATHPSVQYPWRRTQEKALELLFILARLECLQQFKEAPAPLQWHRIIIKNHGGP